MSPDVPLTLCGRADRPESFHKQKCKSFRTKSSARHKRVVRTTLSAASAACNARDRSGGCRGKASVTGAADAENGFNLLEKRACSRRGPIVHRGPDTASGDFHARLCAPPRL